MADGVDTTQNPEKDLIEKEKATLKKLLPLLENFVREKVDLQVSGVRSFTSKATRCSSAQQRPLEFLSTSIRHPFRK